MEKNLRQQIDIFSILRDVAREWITILLFAISGCLLIGMHYVLLNIEKNKSN